MSSSEIYNDQKINQNLKQEQNLNSNIISDLNKNKSNLQMSQYENLDQVSDFMSLQRKRWINHFKKERREERIDSLIENFPNGITLGYAKDLFKIAIDKNDHRLFNYLFSEAKNINGNSLIDEITPNEIKFLFQQALAHHNEHAVAMLEDLSETIINSGYMEETISENYIHDNLIELAENKQYNLFLIMEEENLSAETLNNLAIYAIMKNDVNLFKQIENLNNFRIDDLRIVNTAIMYGSDQIFDHIIDEVQKSKYFETIFQHAIVDNLFTLQNNIPNQAPLQGQVMTWDEDTSSWLRTYVPPPSLARNNDRVRRLSREYFNNFKLKNKTKKINYQKWINNFRTLSQEDQVNAVEKDLNNKIPKQLIDSLLTLAISSNPYLFSHLILITTDEQNKPLLESYDTQGIVDLIHNSLYKRKFDATLALEQEFFRLIDNGKLQIEKFDFKDFYHNVNNELIQIYKQGDINTLNEKLVTGDFSYWDITDLLSYASQNNDFNLVEQIINLVPTSVLATDVLTIAGLSADSRIKDLIISKVKTDVPPSYLNDAIIYILPYNREYALELQKQFYEKQEDNLPTHEELLSLFQNDFNSWEQQFLDSFDKGEIMGHTFDGDIPRRYINYFIEYAVKANDIKLFTDLNDVYSIERTEEEVKNQIEVFDQLTYPELQNLIKEARNNAYMKRVLTDYINKNPKFAEERQYQKEVDEYFVNEVKDNDITNLKEALQNGANINVDNGIALWFVVKNQNYDMLKFLIQNGAIIDSKNEVGLMAAAIDNNDARMVKLLLKGGVNADHEGIFSSAVLNGNFDIIKEIFYELKYEANFDDGFIEALRLNDEKMINLLTELKRILSLDLLIRIKNEGLDTRFKKYQKQLNKRFIDLITDGNLNDVKKAFELGADIDYDDDLPLAQAVNEDKLDVAEFLLDNGANVNSEKRNPLIRAIEGENYKMIDFLIEKGANPDAKNVFMTTIGNVDLEMIKYIFDKIEEEKSFNDGFIAALRSKNERIINFLLSLINEVSPELIKQVKEAGLEDTLAKYVTLPKETKTYEQIYEPVKNTPKQSVSSPKQNIQPISQRWNMERGLTPQQRQTYQQLRKEEDILQQEYLTSKKAQQEFENLYIPSKTEQEFENLYQPEEFETVYSTQQFEKELDQADFELLEIEYTRAALQGDISKMQQLSTIEGAYHLEDRVIETIIENNLLNVIKEREDEGMAEYTSGSILAAVKSGNIDMVKYIVDSFDINEVRNNIVEFHIQEAIQLAEQKKLTEIENYLRKEYNIPKTTIKQAQSRLERTLQQIRPRKESYFLPEGETEYSNPEMEQFLNPVYSTQVAKVGEYGATLAPQRVQPTNVQTSQRAQPTNVQQVRPRTVQKANIKYAPTKTVQQPFLTRREEPAQNIIPQTIEEPTVRTARPRGMEYFGKNKF